MFIISGYLLNFFETQTRYIKYGMRSVFSKMIRNEAKLGYRFSIVVENIRDNRQNSIKSENVLSNNKNNNNIQTSATVFNQLFSL